MASFQEYPKAMKHPAHRAAIISQDRVVNGKIIKAAPGQPERFPPVYVNNVDQEIQYASLGYVPNGESDPDAYVKAIIGANEPQDHQHHEFPKWLYAPDEDGEMSIDTPEGVRIRVKAREVKDKKEQDRLIGEWYATPGDAASAGLADGTTTMSAAEDADTEEEEVEEVTDTEEVEEAPQEVAATRGRGRPRR